MADTHHTPRVRFGPTFIEALKPKDHPYEIADPGTSGLRLRVLPTGRKVFRWGCTARRKVYTIGPWAMCEAPGFVTLAQARNWLERLKEAHAAGTIDAVEAEIAVNLRRRPRFADPVPEDPARRLFATVAEEFYRDDLVRNRKRPEDARRILDVDILPALGARTIDTIDTLACRDVVKRTIARGATVHAGKVLATLKQLFAWAQANGFTDRNPAAPLKGDRIGVEVNESERFLTSEEIPTFWRALDAPPVPVEVARPDPRTGKVQAYAQRLPTLHPTTAAALKILLLTGARSGELLRAKWRDVDLDAATWTIPVENQKLTLRQARKARPFVIPLSPTALALFRDLRRFAESLAPANATPESLAGGWVVASAQSHDGGYSDGALGRAMRRLFEGEPPRLSLPGGEASPHDLRRTVRSHLGETLGISPHIAERCLNHSLGKLVRTYDRGDYLKDRRDALDKWDAYIARLLNPEASTVAFLPAAGGMK